ncbi:hypothetical protein CC85DRAFT_284053 [Cutaneotrichosporon oleaginosum]|uniref:Uncharacterized protein n=1 Tax=Cutaneotrichosporon oleaginosum TaxID=879819 RepID=A0A0J0XSG1_9TREE|nr:uncharacterized protein CC85DRAFT_284053 [Cutaneotrichosporon oleaginosum]KLT44018.1 hypothetical protein CC85DRAFT_284053 [Cutaneotrichosporon oleaginosum]TXT04035.1 hypothetical protein COLE_07732 [Cutaneotrichosporon oleaginosum]
MVDSERFNEGQENAHDVSDKNDQRSIANRIAAAEAEQAERDKDTPEVAALKEDPTAPARMHGNEPSRGAKIDAQLQAEEEAELARKGKA